MVTHRRIRAWSDVESITKPKLVSDLRPFIRVFETEAVKTPVLIGLWQPKLYLPKNWSKWSPRERQGVMAHEIEHLRHRDLWVLGLQFLSLVLYGVNPLVWLVHQKLNQLRELRCDEAAIRQTGIKATEYCRLILKLAEKGTGQITPLVASKYFSQEKRFVSNRINHLLNFEEAKMKTKRVLYYGIPLAMLFLIFLFSWRCSGSNPLSSSDPETPSALSKTDAFEAYDSPPSPIGGFKAVQQKLRYPAIARKAGIEGRVILGVLVDENGSVKQTRVIKSLGKSGCDEAAIQAIKGVEWKPAQRNGKPVKVWVAIPVVFSLNSRAASEPVGKPSSGPFA
ncbi:M56 family metallopeptidase [bacterium]|nr:M56 family metallopeptidase [bacterium]